MNLLGGLTSNSGLFWYFDILRIATFKFIRKS